MISSVFHSGFIFFQWFSLVCCLFPVSMFHFISYLFHWIFCFSDDDTWEPIEHFSSKKSIDDYASWMKRMKGNSLEESFIELEKQGRTNENDFDVVVVNEDAKSFFSNLLEVNSEDSLSEIDRFEFILYHFIYFVLIYLCLVFEFFWFLDFHCFLLCFDFFLGVRRRMNCQIRKMRLFLKEEKWEGFRVMSVIAVMQTIQTILMMELFSKKFLKALKKSWMMCSIPWMEGRYSHVLYSNIHFIWILVFEWWFSWFIFMFQLWQCFYIFQLVCDGSEEMSEKGAGKSDDMQVSENSSGKKVCFWFSLMLNFSIHFFLNLRMCVVFCFVIVVFWTFQLVGEERKELSEKSDEVQVEDFSKEKKVCFCFFFFQYWIRGYWCLWFWNWVFFFLSLVLFSSGVLIFLLKSCVFFVWKTFFQDEVQDKGTVKKLAEIDVSGADAGQDSLLEKKVFDLCVEICVSIFLNILYYFHFFEFFSK